MSGTKLGDAVLNDEISFFTKLHGVTAKKKRG